MLRAALVAASCSHQAPALGVGVSAVCAGDDVSEKLRVGDWRHHVQQQLDDGGHDGDAAARSVPGAQAPQVSSRARRVPRVQVSQVCSTPGVSVKFRLLSSMVQPRVSLAHFRTRYCNI